MGVLRELKRRRVLQTAALYFAGAWGATEILSYLIERIPIFPAWADTVIAILFVLGFPVAMFLAWMFDMGRAGVRRADPASGLGKGVIILSMAGLLAATVVLSYLIWPRVQAERGILTGDLGTVAVLPFENLTGDPSLGYLGVGLSEDVRQRLAMFTDLKVIGRVSMAGFALGGTDLASVRGLLDAGLVVEGSLQNPAGQLRVNVALLETGTGRQIWSNSFDMSDTGWEPLRHLILLSLGEQLEVTVRSRENDQDFSEAALEAYLRALASLSDPEVADGWLEESTRIAPDFADAWARRALLRMDMIWYGLPSSKAWAEGEQFLKHARDFEPDNLMADVAEAQLQWLAKADPFASLAILERAEARAPNHPLVLAGMGTALRYVPEGDREAEIYHRRYLAQDPLNPDAHMRLAASLFFLRRTDESLAHLDRAIELDPRFLLAYEYKANFEFFGNRQADALATFTRRGEVEAPPSDVTRQCLLNMAGHLLPLERAVPMLEDAIQRGIGMMQAHAWCLSALETLHAIYQDVGREEDAAVIIERLARWMKEAGAEPTDLTLQTVDRISESDCDTELCRIEQSLGEDGMAVWLGPEPPLQYFNFHLAVSLSEALIEADREDEGRRLASIAAPVVLDYAGPGGHPSVSAHVVKLLALSGDVEGAIRFAEQVGPTGFFLFGLGMRAWAKNITELNEREKWQAFLDKCVRRRMEEVAKFDRLVARGEIVMP